MITQEEAWLPIKKSNGCYEISNFGNVRSVDRETTTSNMQKRRYKGVDLKPWVSINGYKCVHLHICGTRYQERVHRLVAEAFVSGDFSVDVNHIDGNKLNNSPSNLEFITRSENIKHSYDNGLQVPYWGGRYGRLHHSSKPVEQIKNGIVIMRYSNSSEAARLCGFHQGHISSVALGKLKTHGGYGWRFSDNDIIPMLSIDDLKKVM